ncbi:MAG: hypothetical protein OSJ73_11800 [Lachnospiraceae bacterium]|jgi:hypothetical protein|nr:hypothetical protein [Lachnospiraceae bacterium]
MYLKPTYQKVDKTFLRKQTAEALCIFGYRSCSGFCGKGYEG